MRVFAALPLPAEVQRAVHQWMEGWASDSSGLKLVEEKNLHITLIFFGELPRPSVEELQDSIDTFHFPTISATLGRAGYFPPKGPPRVYYLGLENGREEVTKLQNAFACAVAGVNYRRDPRGFRPHITCARVKRKTETGTLPPAERHYSERLSGLRFEFDGLVLYESRLASSGPTYYPLKNVCLDPAG